jgi:membrane AbrB-like protein
VAAIFSVTNRPVIRFPLFVYRLAQSVIGVMLSFSITAKSLQTIAAHWVPVVTLVLAMLVLTTLIGILLQRFANLQPGTALLGTLPGGAGEMIAMSDSLGADVRLVTVMQYGRLLAILATISFVGHLAGAGGGAGQPVLVADIRHAEPVNYLISAIITMLRESLKQLRPLFTDRSPFYNPPKIPERIQWVKPKLDCE